MTRSSSLGWLLAMGWAGCLAYIAPIPTSYDGSKPTEVHVGPTEAVDSFSVARNGHEYVIFVGRDGAPLAVGFDLDRDAGYWTATTDLVYATGGHCTEGPPPSFDEPKGGDR